MSFEIASLGFVFCYCAFMFMFGAVGWVESGSGVGGRAERMEEVGYGICCYFSFFCFILVYFRSLFFV